MAKLINDESNISLLICFVKNEYLDFVVSRDDNMNWIPFDFELKVSDEIVKYLPEVIKTLSVREIKYLITSLQRIIQIKAKKELFKEQFEFISRENLFELNVYDTNDDDLVYFDFWINIGSLTNGKIFGYSKGYRFDVRLENLKNFIKELDKEFKEICRYL